MDSINSNTNPQDDTIGGLLEVLDTENTTSERNSFLAQPPMTSTTPQVQSVVILNNNARSTANVIATSSVIPSVAPKALVKKVNAGQKEDDSNPET